MVTIISLLFLGFLHLSTFLGFLHPVDLTGSPQDESHIHGYFTPHQTETQVATKPEVFLLGVQTKHLITSKMPDSLSKMSFITCREIGGKNEVEWTGNGINENGKIHGSRQNL